MRSVAMTLIFIATLLRICDCECHAQVLVHGIVGAELIQGPFVVGDRLQSYFKVSYNDDYGDSWLIQHAFELVNPAANQVRIPPSGDLYIIAVGGNTNAVVGGSLPILIGPTGSNHGGLPGIPGNGFAVFSATPPPGIPGTDWAYVIHATDPNPLVVLGTGIAADRCDVQVQNCTMLPITFGGLGATEIGPDCNGNHVLDSIDIQNGTSLDLNGNGIPDECEDCNGNHIPDFIDIQNGTSPDANGNGIPDECEDCNGNGVFDLDDIASGFSEDYNLDNVPDECQSPHAGTATWLNPAGGQFRLHSNWSPDTPRISNNALFDTSSTFSVELDRDIDNNALVVNAGSVTFALGQHKYELFSTDLPGIVVGSASAQTASITVSDGLVKCRRTRIGSGSGSSGMMVVTGANTELLTTETLCIGCSGVGTLEIRDGAVVTSRDATIGEDAGATGTVVISDGAAWILPFFLFIENGVVTVRQGAVLEAQFVGILILNGGRIDGNGTINGHVFNFGGIDPNNFGNLVINGGYTQIGQLPSLGPQSGRLDIGFNDSNPMDNHDTLTINGTASLGGGLFVSATPNSPLPENTPIQFLHAASIDPNHNTFDVAFLPQLNNNKFMFVDYSHAVEGFLGTPTINLMVTDLSSILGFQPPGTTSPGGTPTAVVVGDFNGDAFDDLAITITAGVSGPGSVAVLLNNQTGGFGAPTQFPTGGSDPRALTVGHFDADGSNSLDLAIANTESGSVAILYNNGSGNFSTIPMTLVPAVANHPQSICAANFNGMGPDDIAVTNTGAAGSPGSSIQLILINAPSILTIPPSVFIATNVMPVVVNPADVDNDRDAVGRPLKDLVVANALGNSVTVLRNIGTPGTFPANVGPVVGHRTYPVDVHPNAMTVAKLNGDTLDDIVTANTGSGGGGTLSVLVNTNDGTFMYAPAVNIPAGGTSPRSIVAADLDSDHTPQFADIDLAVLVDDNGTPKVQVIRNDTVNGGLSLSLANADNAGAGAVAVAVGQLNGDAQPDLITVTSGSPLSGDNDGDGLRQVNEVRYRFNSSKPPSPSCPGDITGNHLVDVDDLLVVISHWGPCPLPCPPHCGGDVAPQGGNCLVNVDDLLGIVTTWGPCPSK